MFKCNRVELTGRIAKRARRVSDKVAVVAHARLVHDESLHRRGGDPIEWITAIEIEVGGRRGEAFAQLVTPETDIYIQGSLQIDECGEGEARRLRLFVRVSEWQILGPVPPATNIPKSA